MNNRVYTVYLAGCHTCRPVPLRYNEWQF